MSKEFWTSINELELARKQILDHPEFAPDELLKYLNFNNKIVLDFGCGIGRNLKYLSTTTAKQIIGIDLQNMLELAKQFLTEIEQKRITLSTSSMNLSQIDIIIATIVFQHIDNIGELDDILFKLGSRIKHNGILYVHSRGYIDVGHDLNADRNVWHHILKWFDPITTVNSEDSSETHQRVLFKLKRQLVKVSK